MKRNKVLNPSSSRSYLFAIVLTASSACFGQGVTLDLASGSGSPGSTVTLNVSLGGTATDPPASVEWTLDYSPVDIASASIALGPVATAANKSISCNNVAGAHKCVVWGMGSTISNGVVATVSLTLLTTTTNTSSLLQLANADAADSAANSLSTSTTGGTVTILQQFGLNGFTCNPV